MKTDDTELALSFYQMVINAWRLYLKTLSVYRRPCGSIKTALARACLAEKGIPKNVQTEAVLSLFLTMAEDFPDHRYVPILGESQRDTYLLALSQYQEMKVRIATEKGP